MFGIRSYRAGAFKRPSNPTDAETVGRLRLTVLCGDVAHPAEARGVARWPLKLIARLGA